MERVESILSGRRLKRRAFCAAAGVGFLLAAPAAALAGAVGVIPILIGPFQVLMAILPAVLLALGGAFVALVRPSAVKAGLKILWRNKLAAVIAAGAVVGIVYLCSYLLGGGPVASAASGTAAGWPAFRGGPHRRGTVPRSPEPAAGGVVWAFSSEEKTFYSSPAVVGNRVFVASGRARLFGERGAIYCLDADNGAVVWKYSPRDFRPTYSSPSAWGGYVVCGEGLHVTRDARVTCLKAETGERLWELRTASHVESSPCIYDGKVYVGAGDDGLYCIALRAAPGGKANVLWHLDGRLYPDCETSPLASGGRVYFGLGNGGKAIVCVDADTGRQLWRVEAPYPVFGSPAIADGMVFVGMGNGDMINTAEAIGLKPAGEVWALDPDSGEVKWTCKVGETILGAIVAADGRVYFASRDGDLHCLGTGGERLGRWSAHEPIVTSPAVGTDHVYFITASGRLYALDRGTLSLLWQVRVGAGGLFTSSPSVARGHVYVGTENDGLVCVGRPGRREYLWAGRLGGPGNSGCRDGSALASTGRFAWRYPRKAGGQDVPTIQAPAAYLERSLSAGGDKSKVEKALFVCLAGPRRCGLVKLVLDNRLRRPPRQAWFYPTPNAPVHSPAAGGRGVYFVDGRAGQAGRRLHCVDAVSGRRRWTLRVAPDAPGEVLLGRDRLLAFVSGSSLACIGLSGQAEGGKIWSRTFGRPVGSPAVVEDVILLSSRSLPGVIAVSPAGGEVLWESRLSRPPTTGPVGRRVRLARAASGAGPPADGAPAEDRFVVVVATREGLTALSLIDGSQLWSAPFGPVAGPIVCDENHVACAARSSEIFVVDWRGRQVARVTGASPEANFADSPPIAAMPPMLCRDQLLYCSAKGLVRVQLPSGRLFRWRETAWMGRVTAPPIMAASHVYFATSGKGLVCVGPARK